MADCQNCIKKAKASAACCKNGKDGYCELTTITASQLSAGLVFLAYIFMTLSRSLSLNVKNPINGHSDYEFSIRIQIYIAYASSLIYYFIGCWKTEEEMIDKLRELHPLIFHTQWWIRIFVLVWIGFYSTLSNDSRLGDNDVMIQIAYLIIVYILFLIWDFFVIIGGKFSIIKNYVLIDFAGFAFFAAFRFSYDKKEIGLLAISILLCFLLAVAELIISFKALKSLSRIFYKSKIR